MVRNITYCEETAPLKQLCWKIIYCQEGAGQKNYSSRKQLRQLGLNKSGCFKDVADLEM